MKAAQLINERKNDGETAFLQMVIWQVPQPVPGSTHLFKYRLVYVVADECVLRYDNETGKGDHKHLGGAELPYAFTSIAALIADFRTDIQRWKDENGLV
ncbi:DUF6516 family protein [Thermomonas sp.]|uniref:toxin-antitoxin system TumE family protein n=1 Tax=Thermomonas sp. TaxID=1971895 RepID=UPI0035B0C71E